MTNSVMAVVPNDARKNHHHRTERVCSNGVERNEHCRRPLANLPGAIFAGTAILRERCDHFGPKL